jgi:hypothetical protein
MKRLGASSTPEAYGSLCILAPHPRDEKGPKIVFHAEDVPTMRETLVARGAKFAKPRQGDVFCLCDGKDPDGNPLQLSNR